MTTMEKLQNLETIVNQRVLSEKIEKDSTIKHLLKYNKLEAVFGGIVGTWEFSEMIKREWYGGSELLTVGIAASVMLAAGVAKGVKKGINYLKQKNHY